MSRAHIFPVGEEEYAVLPRLLPASEVGLIKAFHQIFIDAPHRGHS